MAKGQFKRALRSDAKQCEASSENLHTGHANMCLILCLIIICIVSTSPDLCSSWTLLGRVAKRLPHVPSHQSCVREESMTLTSSELKNGSRRQIEQTQVKLTLFKMPQAVEDQPNQPADISLRSLLLDWMATYFCAMATSPKESAVTLRPANTQKAQFLQLD